MSVDYSHMQVPAPAVPAPTVVTLNGVAPERVAWLWPGRMPLGKLVVIDGDPSTGKSTLTLDLAARVSRGAEWPDGSPGRSPAGVLLLSAEDGIADTIVPRLTAAGADLAHVHALTDVPVTDEDGEVRQVPPALPRDVGTIESVITKHRVRLVVVDVLMAYLSGKVDSHRDQDVRGVLHLLSAMAERTGCTVVLIRHLNKAGGSNALYRGGGSIGIVGAARAAYLVARDPEDEDRRIFAVTKCNLAIEPPSLAYRLTDDPTNGCARIEWEDAPVEHTAASLLRGPVDDEDRTERDEAAAFIRDYLADNGGSQPSRDVLKAGRAAGFNDNLLKKARARAGARTERQGFGKAGAWVWTIDGTPIGAAIGAIGAGQSEPESMTPMVPTAAPMRLQSVQPPAPPEDDLTADCGHPIKAINTANGKCALCITARLQPKPSTTCRACEEPIDPAAGAVHPGCEVA